MDYNETMKALLCCADINDKCSECPLKDKDRESCAGILMSNVVGLINHKEEVISKRSLLLLKVSEENERLLNQNRNLRCVIDDLCDQVNTAKADAVKEYVAMVKANLIEGGIYPVLVKNTLDKVKKEMVGED